MLGMSQEQLEQAIHEWFESNQDKVSMFIEGFEAAGADDDDVYNLVSKVMASVGSTVAMSAVTEIIARNNALLSEQIDALIEERIAAALKKS
ncbi:hypothetical protein [Anaeroarcus burkinensis]|uniref:hypothetical protein n=1 Tax=Anaeroarcus burkinensis TaxID=82376 RepID=UPI0003FB257E|nr:hypothetical protein [Anaeroarcus burkinensis]